MPACFDQFPSKPSNKSPLKVVSRRHIQYALFLLHVVKGSAKMAALSISRGGLSQVIQGTTG